MSNITQVDFKTNSLLKDIIQKKDFNALLELFEKEKLNNEQEQLKFIKTIDSQEELISLFKKLEQISDDTQQPILDDKEMIINVPKRILNSPIGTFVKEFCVKNQMREGTALTTMLTVTSGFVQNIFKIKPFSKHIFETPLGIYYFGDSPAGSGKTPLYRIIAGGIQKAHKQSDIINQKYYSKSQFPPVFGEGTNGGIETNLEKFKISSFTIESTEKDIVKSLLCLPSHSVSNFTLLLKGWLGEHHQSCRRIGGFINGRQIYGSLLSLAQEGTVKSIINNDIKNGEFSNGFDARCIFTIEPVKNIESDYLESNFADYETSFQNIFFNLLNRYYYTLPTPNCFEGLQTINLSYESAKLVNDAPGKYRKIFKEKSKQSYMNPFIEKTRVHIQKVAFSLYILNEGLQKKDLIVGEILPHDYVQMAYELVMEYVWNHFNVFRYCELSDEQLEKSLILDLFNKKNSYTIRQICAIMRQKPCYIKKYGRSNAYQAAKKNIEALIQNQNLSLVKNEKNKVCLN